MTMSTELVLSVTATLLVVAAGVRVARWMEQTSELRISLFRPYRADGWPHGVQEEDEVHWRWDVPIRSARAAGDGQADDPDAGRPATADEPALIVEGGRAVAGRIGPVRVGRPAAR